MKTKIALLICFALLTATNVLAQATATIVGAVTDSSGKVIANARVAVTQKETGLTRQVTTNDRGFYVVHSLPVGEYTVGVEAPGFKRKSVTGVTLQVNEEPRIDVALEVGAVSETVTVNSQAPLLQTESAADWQSVVNGYKMQITLTETE